MSITYCTVHGEYRVATRDSVADVDADPDLTSDFYVPVTIYPLIGVGDLVQANIDADLIGTILRPIPAEISHGRLRLAPRTPGEVAPPGVRLIATTDGLATPLNYKFDFGPGQIPGEASPVRDLLRDVKIQTYEDGRDIDLVAATPVAGFSAQGITKGDEGPPFADALVVTDDGLYQFTLQGEPIGEPFGPPTMIDGGTAADADMPILDGGNANGGPIDSNPLARRMTQRRGTSAQWTTAGDPALLAAELGYDSTLDRLFYGNGSAAKSARSMIALLSDLTAFANLGIWGNITGDLTDQADLVDALNSRAAAGHVHLLAAITDITATAADLNKLAGRVVTGTELDFVHGVTSAIQTQLNGKGVALPNPCATSSYGIPGVRLSGATSTVAMATGTMYYGTLMEVRKAITITEWSARASNVASAGNLRVGIWAADNFMQPGALIYDSGSVAVASGSSFNVTVTGQTIVLQPGLYIVGLTPSIAMTLQVLLSAGDVIARPRVSNPMVNRFEAAFTYGALAANGPAWTVQQTSATSGWHNFLGFVWTVN